jgi:hypothetical protein
MNYARKVRELEKIFFNESKENEHNKNELIEINRKYKELQILCRDLLNNYDNKENIEDIIIKIKYHLMY